MKISPTTPFPSVAQKKFYAYKIYNFLQFQMELIDWITAPDDCEMSTLIHLKLLHTDVATNYSKVEPLLNKIVIDYLLLILPSSFPSPCSLGHFLLVFSICNLIILICNILVLILINFDRFCNQGSKGIRHWPINWCTTSPMMIHKITPSVDNYLLVVETFEHSTK